MRIYEFILYGDGGLYREGGLFGIEHYVAESFVDAVSQYCKKHYARNHSVDELYLSMLTPSDIIKKVNDWTQPDEIVCVQTINNTLYYNLD